MIKTRKSRQVTSSAVSELETTLQKKRNGKKAARAQTPQAGRNTRFLTKQHGRF